MTIKDMEDLAITDKNAARLMAFFMASDESMPPESRSILLKAALGLSDTEFERCIGVLDHKGFGKVVWKN